jgi:drug/metabolite transporter (DMT)-like permease
VLFLKKNIKLNKRDLSIAIIIGFLGSVVALGIFYYGLDITNAITASFLERSWPLFAVVFAVVFLKEELSRTDIFGIVLVLLGSFIMIYRPDVMLEVIGGLLLLLAAVLWGITTILGKHLLKTVDHYVVTFYRLLIAAIGGILIALFSGQVNLDLSLSVWYAIILSGVLPAFLGFLFYYKGLSMIKASKTATITSFTPLFAIVYAFLLLGEVITLVQIIGGILIIIGAVFLARTKS